MTTAMSMRKKTWFVAPGWTYCMDTHEYGNKCKGLDSHGDAGV